MGNVWNNDTDVTSTYNKLKADKNDLLKRAAAEEKNVRNAYSRIELLKFKNEILAQAKLDAAQVVKKSHADAGEMVLTSKSYIDLMAWNGEVEKYNFDDKNKADNGNVYSSERKLTFEFSDGKYFSTVTYDISGFSKSDKSPDSIVDCDTKNFQLYESGFIAKTDLGKYDYNPEKGWEREPDKDSRLLDRFMEATKGKLKEFIDPKNLISKDRKWEGKVDVNLGNSAQLNDKKEELEDALSKAQIASYKADADYLKDRTNLNYRERILASAQKEILDTVKKPGQNIEIILSEESAERLKNLSANEELKSPLNFTVVHKDSTGSHPIDAEISFNANRPDLQPSTKWTTRNDDDIQGTSIHKVLQQMREQNVSVNNQRKNATIAKQEAQKEANIFNIKQAVLEQAKQDTASMMHQAKANGRDMWMTEPSFEQLMKWNGDLSKGKGTVELEFTDGKFTSKLSYDISALAQAKGKSASNLESPDFKPNIQLKDSNLSAKILGTFEYEYKGGEWKQKDTWLSERLRTAMNRVEKAAKEISNLSIFGKQWDGKISSKDAEEGLAYAERNCAFQSQQSFSRQWDLNAKIQDVDFREKILQSAEVQVLNAMDSLNVKANNTMKLTKESEQALLNLKPQDGKIKLVFQDQEANKSDVYFASVEINFDGESLKLENNAEVEVGHTTEKGTDIFENVKGENNDINR